MCKTGKKFVYKMSKDSVNRTDATNDTNATITETKSTLLPEKNVEESLFLLDSASLIGIFIAIAVVLVTVGELTYGGPYKTHSGAVGP